MLLNWHTIDACFLSSAFHIRSASTFFLSCLASFLLAISLEFLRRAQRDFDRFLYARNSKLQDEEYISPDNMEEKLLPSEGQKYILRGKMKGMMVVIVAEQLLRGLIHTVQFSVSYCIMLLFMYSNGTYLPRARRLRFGFESSENRLLTFRRVHHYVYSSWSPCGFYIIHQGYLLL
jgi:copper transporter 1